MHLIKRLGLLLMCCAVLSIISISYVFAESQPVPTSSPIPTSYPTPPPFITPSPTPSPTPPPPTPTPAIPPPFPCRVMSVSSSNLNGTYGAGDIIEILVFFNAAVNVTGSPRILLRTGETDRYAYFAGFRYDDYPISMLFRYEVQPGDCTARLDYVSADSLELNGGTITCNSYSANLALPVPGAAGSLGASRNIVITNADRPVVTNVTAEVDSGTFKFGEVIPIKVFFSSNVFVTGLPALQLETGTNKRYAVYSEGSGSNVLTFSYQVQDGDFSERLDYYSENPVVLFGAKIRSSEGLEAGLTFPIPGQAGSLSANNDIAIDSIRIPAEPLSEGCISWYKDMGSAKDNLFGIAYGAGKFVAVGRDGLVKTSNDGSVWKNRKIEIPAIFQDITYGLDKLIAVGYEIFGKKGVIAESVDGIIWEARILDTAGQINAIASSSSAYVAVGNAGEIIVSDDGNIWTRVESGTTNELLDIAYNGIAFAAVGANGTILYSTDASVWTPQVSGRNGSIRGIAWNGSKFVAVGDNGAILSSPDGLNWTSSQWNHEYVFLNDVACSEDLFVAAGTSLGPTGSIFTSTDGVEWTPVESPDGLTQGIYGLTYSHGIFAAIGYNDIILTSPDGIVWTTQVSGSELNGWYNGIAENDAIFAAVGTSGEIMTSQDGRTWTPGNYDGLQQLYAIASDGSRFVAVGETSIITSEDGITWEAVKTGRYSAVMWDGSHFMAIGGSGVVVSQDGSEWTTIASISSQFEVFETEYNGSRYVAAGMNSSMGGICGIIMVSTNGSEWIPVKSPIGIMYSIVWNGEQFVAVGGKSYNYSSGPFESIYVSPDGFNWTERTSQLIDNRKRDALKSVIWDGDKFVAVGYTGTILASRDGFDWIQLKSTTINNLYAIAFDGEQYAVLGDERSRLRGFNTASDQLAGDCNHDNKVGMDDLTIVAAAYGSRKGEIRYNADADLNKDDKVDMDDLYILKQAYVHSY